MFRLLLPLVLAAGIGLFGLTGCAVTLRGSITPVTAEELVQKGVSDKLYDYLFGAKTEEKES